jgi:hypothetical protein
MHGQWSSQATLQVVKEKTSRLLGVGIEGFPIDSQSSKQSLTVSNK